MTSSEIRLPGYAKSTIILFGLCLVAVVLYVGRDILIPIAFAAFIAILLQPFCDFLISHKFPKLLAISITVFLACIVFVGVAAFVGVEIGTFTEDFPKLKARALQYFRDIQRMVQQMIGLSSKEQLGYMEEGANAVLTGEDGLLSLTWLTLMDMITLAVMVPLYLFLFLFYKNLLVDFVFRIFADGDANLVRDVMSQVRIVVKSYLVGLMFETIIIACLNILALFLLGIEYAIFFGVLAALLNLIPYIGIIIGSLFPVIMALISKDSIGYALGVIGSFAVIQFIDNNIVVPAIVAQRVRLNAIVSIIAVIVGGMLWGISGMFLSLPILAIMKVVFDRVESLKPWGLLCGDEIPEERRTFKASRGKKKVRSESDNVR